MRANTVRPLAVAAAAKRSMVSFGPKPLATAVSPSIVMAGILRTHRNYDGIRRFAMPEVWAAATGTDRRVSPALAKDDRCVALLALVERLQRARELVPRDDPVHRRAGRVHARAA